MAESKEKIYVYDLDAIMSFIFDDDGQRNNDMEITETYIPNDEDAEDTGSLVLINKQLREVKGSDNTGKQTIRYDIMKFMLETLNGIEGTAEVSTLGEKIVLNTLLTNSMIKVMTQS